MIMEHQEHQTGGTVTTPQVEKALNTFQRMWGMIVNPGETFREILARPFFLVAMLLFVAASVAVILLILPKMLAFVVLEVEKLGAAELAAYQEHQESWVIGVTIVGAVIAPLITWLICALALKFYNMFVGKQVLFRQFFAVAVFAHVPVLLGSLVYASLVRSAPAENFDRVTTSLAALMPEAQGFIYLLLVHADPFVFWAIVLLGIGGALAMQVSVRSTTLYLLGLWALYALGAATLGTVFAPGPA
jgi:hypothetical protein